MLTVALAARSPIETDSVSAEMYLRSLSGQFGPGQVPGVELTSGALDLAPTSTPPSDASAPPPLRSRILEGRARLRRWLWHDEELRIYRQATASVDLAEPIEPLARNSIADLLKYEDGSRDGMSRQEFLRMALDRLEDGWTAYSISEDGLLLNSRWVVTRVGRLPLDPYHEIPLPRDAVYFADVFTDPRGRGRGFQIRGTRYCAQQAARLPGVRWIVAAVLGSNGRSIHNVEQAGYHHAASTFTRRRFGMERSWQANAP